MQYGDPIWEAIYQQRVWGQYPSEEAVIEKIAMCLQKA